MPSITRSNRTRVSGSSSSSLADTSRQAVSTVAASPSFAHPTLPGQRHFFAGIGGWSYALRLAGVPDSASIWTGSCPCQPFSDAGKGLGIRDPRHLWPTWFDLIRECRPTAILGEQVASRDGLLWLDLVRADLEGCGYSFGASDLCAAGVGAPHIRQRLYFVAFADRERREGLGLRLLARRSRSTGAETRGGSTPRGRRQQPAKLAGHRSAF
jgi:hypothetical protein